VAAYALIVLLIALFPANVYAAQAGVMVAGQPASPLIWRLPLQLFWMWSLWWSVQERSRVVSAGRASDRLSTYRPCRPCRRSRHVPPERQTPLPGSPK
jgi:hypothetical protein